jgi:hypothetical protein
MRQQPVEAHVDAKHAKGNDAGSEQRDAGPAEEPRQQRKRRQDVTQHEAHERVALDARRRHVRPCLGLLKDPGGH